MMGKEYTHFITNREKTLAQTISNISNSIENIYILVGFFYFSGYFKLKDEFKNKNIQILVGLDIEKKLGKLVSEYEIQDKQDFKGIGTLKNNFYKSVVNAFAYLEMFDKEEIKESLKIFDEKLKNGTIEIRKTKEPNHAKLYIFENNKEHSENGEYPGVVITGSSNLSLEGLEKRFEIDVVTREKSYYNEAKDIFNKLWQNSIPVASKQNYEEFKKEVIKKIWPFQLPSPYEVYIRVLKEYFSVNQPHVRMPKDINRTAMNLKYQMDAISMAIDIIKKHNGVIIADVVGLGKSIIASSIAHNLNLDTIVIAPPHLKEQWDDYRRRFKFMGEVYSSGKIDKAIKDYSDNGNEKLIIVDEAHRYRNSDTINYNLLWQLCQGNRVVLLTATPFNNTPEDLYSIISLFQIPTKSTLKHIENLNAEFRKLITDYKNLKKRSKQSESKKEEVETETERISKEVRYIISPVTIRRTRVDLEKINEYKKDLQTQGIIFPKVNPPDVVSYSFSDLDQLYIETIEKFLDEDKTTKHFIGARYKTIQYISDISYKTDIAMEYTGEKTKAEALQFIEVSQSNLSDLLKRLFVKRFESSFGSFKNTLNDYITSHKKIKAYYEHGKVPIYKKFEKLPDITDIDSLESDEVEEIYNKLKSLENDDELIWVESSKLSKDFINDIDNDIKILEGIQKDWYKYLNNPDKYDYKLEKLVNILYEKIEKKEKVIIFSEYEDTVNYLKDMLDKKGFKAINYSSSTSSESLKDTIEENFDASIMESKWKNDYDILITTDILSEGINLHRANNIINYDIPYNPTRVIQRIGRVNRVTKLKLKDINIHNFFPTSIGEKHTHIKNISTLKIHMIHALLGEDMKYLTNDEEIKSFFYEEYKKSEFMEEESWDTKYRNFLYSIEEGDINLIEKVMSIPYRTKIGRKTGRENACLTFARKGENFIFKIMHKKDNSEKIETITDEEAIKMFEADIKEQPFEVSSDFEEKYKNIKKSLFSTQSQTMTTKSERDVISKMEKLIETTKNENHSEYINYLEKLKKIVDLNFIPDYIARSIKEVKYESLEDLKKLTETIPEYIIDKILNRVNEIDNASDVIIISEEIVL
ncbi:MAG: hypothetical protein KA059_02265 [Elusimicrobiales bacterium]|nr:hypothetical protein [Elusimicrobiales bacterium]